MIRIPRACKAFYRLEKVGSCALNIPLFCSKHAQLPVGKGRAILVAMLFLNRQGLLVPLFRRLKIPLLLGNYAQLMVGTGRIMLIALLLPNRQGLLVPLFAA